MKSDLLSSGEISEVYPPRWATQMSFEHFLIKESLTKLVLKSEWNIFVSRLFLSISISVSKKFDSVFDYELDYLLFDKSKKSTIENESWSFYLLRVISSLSLVTCIYRMNQNHVLRSVV